MSERLFTANDAWKGGFYHLALEIGPRSDDLLTAALAALWRHPDLDGVWLGHDREPNEQPRVALDHGLNGSHLLGVARVPNGARVACCSIAIRECDDGPDWLCLCLPMGSLRSAYPVGGFPFGASGESIGPWRSDIDDWLAGIGLWVAKSAAFRLGLIGHDAHGQEHASDIATRGIPTERWFGYLWPAGDSVAYYPATERGPYFT